MDDQPNQQMLHHAAQANPGILDPSHEHHGLINPRPDPAHVYQEGANQPAGANAVHDPKRGVEAGQPVDATGTASTSNPQGDPNTQGVEEKLPFKEQVRAYHKVHRGTLLGDHEQKETGQKILAGEIPPQ